MTGLDLQSLGPVCRKLGLLGSSKVFLKRYPMIKRPLCTFAILVAAFFCLSDCASAGSGTPTSPTVEMVTMPGPLRSFLRMARLSQKVAPVDVLPLLSRNIFMQGYQRGTQ